MSIFSIGLSGLSAASDELDSISQNIANSSTTGYKSETTTFSASYSGSQATGVEVASTTQSFDNDGDLVETDDDLDVAISGSGFFVLSDGTTTTYTRSGDFSMDSDYNIVSSSGAYVQGYSADSDGNISYGALTNLSVDATISAQASTSITLTANLNSDATTVDTTTNAFDSTDSSTYNYSISTEIYDSLGSSHTLSEYYVKTGDNTWSVYYSLDGTTLDTSLYSASLTFDSDGTLTSVTYNNNSSTSTTSTNSTAALTLDLGSAADDISLSIDMSDIDQYSSSFSSTSEADGYTSGSLSESYFDDEGQLWATYDNGETVLQGQLVIATFTNPEGLDTSDGTSWTATTESGAATLTTAGSGSAGSLSVGYYENSNVDVSTELVDLMSAQQYYQANAKVLTAADDMSSVLFNM